METNPNMPSEADIAEFADVTLNAGLRQLFRNQQDMLTEADIEEFIDTVHVGLRHLFRKKSDREW